MTNKFYDITGIIGFTSTMISSWVTNIELIGKVLGIVGGLVLLIFSIVHKILEIRHQSSVMKKYRKDILHSVEETVKSSITEAIDNLPELNK